jgi:CMP-2-keto-3-deoxyoctulosonic acid synthetase
MVFIVGFTPSSLTEFIAWGESSLELREPNEFLRILENGKKIKIVNIEKAKISLDTQEDLEEIRALMQIDSLVKSYM